MQIIYFPESHERDISAHRHHTSIPGAVRRLQEGNGRAVVCPVPRGLSAYPVPDISFRSLGT